MDLTNRKPIFQLADAFLSLAPMTEGKLEKLCYYAQAWYLTFYDKRLVPEDFEADLHGAAQPDLRVTYEPYSHMLIPQKPAPADVPDEYLRFAQKVYTSYGHLSELSLEYLNHREDPWILTRKGCQPWESCHNKIQDKDIKDYYKKLLQAQKEDDHMILQSIQSDTFSTKSVILFLSLFTALLIIGDVLLWFRPPIGKIFMMITTTGLLLSIIIGGNISFHHRRNTEKTKKEKTHD